MSGEMRQNSRISVVVHDSISVADVLIVAVTIARLTTWGVRSNRASTIVSLAEYRQLVGDHTSTDERITERLQYLEAFCRNIIRPELQKLYEQGTRTIRS